MCHPRKTRGACKTTYNKERGAEYRRKNRERIRQYSKEYYQKNREKILQRTKKYRELHPEKKRQYDREHRAERIQRDNERNRKLRLETMNKLGGSKCMDCGYSDIRALDIDHINGREGKSRRPIQAVCREILKMSQGEARAKYQVLCRNCNWIKHLEER